MTFKHIQMRPMSYQIVGTKIHVRVAFNEEWIAWARAHRGYYRPRSLMWSFPKALSREAILTVNRVFDVNWAAPPEGMLAKRIKRGQNES